MTNLLNNNYNFTGSLYNFKNIKLKKVYSLNTAGTTDVDLYTTPANKQAVILGWTGYNNTFSTSLIKIKISGTYYTIRRLTDTFNALICLDAGQTLAVNMSAAGANLWFVLYEFDSTTTLSINYTTSFINGNNTLYTCPSNTIAVPLTFVNTNGSASGFLSNRMFPSINSPACGIWNSSGGAISYTSYVVTSGGSPAVTNDFSASTSLNTNNGSYPFWSQTNPTTVSSHLTAGESIVIASNSANAGQFGWVYALQIPT